MALKRLLAANKRTRKASPQRRSRRLGAQLQCLEDRRMMAGDVAMLPLESEFVETSTLATPTSDWSMNPIGDLEFAGGGEAFEVELTASGNIESEDLIFSASIVPSLAQELDSQYDLTESDDYHTNCLGQNNRWIRSDSAGWFYLTPEGEFFRWRGSFDRSLHLGSFDTSYYDNPDLLTDPESPDVDVVVEGDILRIMPSAEFTGSFQIEVGATDGVQRGPTDLVLVTVTEPIDDFKTPPADEDDPVEDETPPPVLMVIANQDFYYQEYADTRASLEAAGLEVVVAATTTETATPHANSGQGDGSGHVTPDLALSDANADDYSAIVFVGGWGAASYQYAFEGTYNNGSYNSTEELKSTVNDLINDFVDQDKYVSAICHGVSVLAWARVDGVSPISGKTVSAWANTSPGSDTAFHTTRQEIEYNGGSMVQSGSIGDPTTATDDVIVDGRIITAENYDSAAMFGQVLGDAINDPAYIDEVFAEWE